jgi:hypothetical protein
MEKNFEGDDAYTLIGIHVGYDPKYDSNIGVFTYLFFPLFRMM